MNESTADWASENFGGAELGDSRRVARLVAVAEQAARTPAGKVTQVFESSADREGAFRLLENAAVSSEGVAQAVFDASAARSADQRFIYVALDGTTLTFTDRTQRRELGRVGTRWPTRGLHVMSALGIDDQGAVLGLLDQIWWARTSESKAKQRKNKTYGSKYLERETRYWLESIENVSERLEKHASGVTAWYQLDRGADCWPVLSLAIQRKLLITVRSSFDRRLVDDPNGRRRYLRETLKKRPVLGHFDIELPARPDRPARTARVALRSCPVVILARVGKKKWTSIAINAVLAEEQGYSGKDRLCWFLLTTAPVATFEQAQAVVEGYTLRWRVEEFHRAWKRGGCRVEESQLQSRSAIIKWATILGAVATRALRISKLLRTAPETPASVEFTKYEIAATFALARRKHDPRHAYTLKEVVGVIADLGGFANKYSGGHPGPTVLGRGLQKIQVIALALQNIEEMR